jgi:protein subunit release factor A
MIPVNDLLAEPSDPEPRGGQHTNGPAPTGVKITHIPTQTVAISRLGRSQFANREIALEMLEAALTHPRAIS